MGAERFDLVFVDFHFHDRARSRSVRGDDNVVFPCERERTLHDGYRGTCPYTYTFVTTRTPSLVFTCGHMTRTVPAGFRVSAGLLKESTAAFSYREEVHSHKPWWPSNNFMKTVLAFADPISSHRQQGQGVANLKVKKVTKGRMVCNTLCNIQLNIQSTFCPTW